MKSEENYMELNELPDELANIRHIHTFVAPLNYFDGLAEDIISKVQLPLTSDMPLSAPPVNYFDGLADTILVKIKTASAQSEVERELEELEPLLTTISKANLYRVPNGYFDSFTVAVPLSDTKKSASILSMHRSQSWFSYAAAAVVAAVIATTVLFSVKQNINDINSANAYSKAIARVSDNELSDYLDQTSQDADIISVSQDDDVAPSGESIYNILLNNVTDTELENYLNENDDSDEKNIKGI